MNGGCVKAHNVCLDSVMPINTLQGYSVCSSRDHELVHKRIREKDISLVRVCRAFALTTYVCWDEKIMKQRGWRRVSFPPK